MLNRRNLLIAGAALMLPRPALARLARGSAAAAANGLKINLVYDTSPVNWNTAPAYYQADVITAANMIMAACPNTNITVNIEVGYTEIENFPGTVAPSTSIGDDLILPQVPYSAIRGALSAIPNPTASLIALLANTPGGITLNGTTNFLTSGACCKALGLFGVQRGTANCHGRRAGRCNRHRVGLDFGQNSWRVSA